MRRTAIVPLLLLLCLPVHAAAEPALLPLKALLRTGRYAEVPAAHKRLMAGAAIRSAPLRAQADALLGEALRKSGRLKEAEELLQAAMARDPASLAVRIELGLCYRQDGQRDRERALWNRTFDEHDAGGLDLKDPAAVRRLAMAARYLGSFKDANDTFRDAVDLAKEKKLGEEIVQANIEWARLLMEKYNVGEAELCLQEALAQDPDDPDARALLAQVKLEQGNDVAGAEREIDRALKINPRHAEALAARAEILIDNEQYADALKVTAALLRDNPQDLQARSLSAAAHLLAERPAEYEAEKRRVLAQHPRYTAFYRTVAELLTTQHRYDDAVALLKEAVALDEKDYYALAALGSGYLRLGQDEPGIAALRRAWRGDKYNVRTHNLLKLFEDVIPKDYELVTVDIDRRAPGQGGLRIRLPARERALLLPILVPFIQDEWQELTRRYQFTPRLPITLELYADPQHYAVRTVGLPGLAALGVTFGQVVTGRSPAQGAFNWGLMVWHELSHVFAIQLSRSRVPRWFTEGLSEWETTQARKEWTRRTNAELYAALRDGRLPSLRELNAGFTRARDVAHIVVAYHEAAAAMDFLIRRFGFPPIVQALKLFAQGKQTEEVLTRVTGQGLDALDAAFRADLAQKLTAYKGTFYVRPSDYSDIEGLKEQLKQRPGDLRLRGLHALALLAAGDGNGALSEAQAVLKLDPAAREARLAAGDVLLRRKDLAAAEKEFQSLLLAGGDGYDVRLRLGVLAAKRGDLAAAERELSRAKQLDPDRPEPYTELARLYTERKREADALRELSGAAVLEIMDADLLRGLTRRLHAARRYQDVVRFGEMARFVEPYSSDLRAHIGEALLNLGQAQAARRELDAALLALPTPSDEEEAAQIRKRRQEIQQLRARLK
jgi:tetratricopeptide (TPR) repeat protein